MKTISKNEIIRLAQLAKLRLHPDEVEQFTEEINTILQYVTQLQDVDVSGLEPTIHIGKQTNVTRKDEIRDYKVSTEDLLKNAPNLQQNQFKVRRVL